MSKMTIRVYIKTNKIGSKCEDTFTIDTEDYDDGNGGLDMGKVEKVAKNAAFQMMEWDFEIEET